MFRDHPGKVCWHSHRHPQRNLTLSNPSHMCICKHRPCQRKSRSCTGVSGSCRTRRRRRFCHPILLGTCMRTCSAHHRSTCLWRCTVFSCSRRYRCHNPFRRTQTGIRIDIADSPFLDAVSRHYDKSQTYKACCHSDSVGMVGIPKSRLPAHRLCS